MQLDLVTPTFTDAAPPEKFRKVVSDNERGACPFDTCDPSALMRRADLLKRLDLLVEYQGAQRWDKVYDLLPASAKGGRSRQEYADRRRDSEAELPTSTLLSFVPSEAVTVEMSGGGGAWQLLGCGTYLRQGGVTRLKSAVSVELRQGEWFLSEIGVAKRLDGPEESCPVVAATVQRAQSNARPDARPSSRCARAQSKRAM